MSLNRLAPRSRLTVERLEDRVVLFTACGSTWATVNNQIPLSYNFSNLFDGGIVGINSYTVLQAVEESLSTWARYVPFVFTEATAGGNLSFGHQDLQGSVVGQATCPRGGTVRWDSSARTYNTSLFLFVGVHEVGHMLGLGHSTTVTPRVDNPGAAGPPIMNPSVQGIYGGLGSSFLFQDDVTGMRSRYRTGVGDVITTRNWTSAADGNWDTDASWTRGFEPTINSNVSISNGRTVTINSAVRRARQVSIAPAAGTTGALQVDAGSLTVRGPIQLGALNGGQGSLLINGGTVGAIGLQFRGNAAAQQQYVDLAGGTLDLSAPVTDGTGTSILLQRGGALDLNNHALDVDQFLYYGGVLRDVNGVFTVKNQLDLGAVTLDLPTLLLQGGLVVDANEIGAARLNGFVNLSGGARTFTVPDINLAGSDLVVSAALDNGGLVKSGLGTLRLESNNFYTDLTNVNEGQLLLMGSNVLSSLTTVAKGASLRGSGASSALLSFGTLLPGEGIGAIYVDGAYVQGATGRLQIDLGGSEPSTGYDQVYVNGDAMLAGELLPQLMKGFELTPGATFDVLWANSIDISNLTLAGELADFLSMEVVQEGDFQALRLTVLGSGAPGLRGTAVPEVDFIPPSRETAPTSAAFVPPANFLAEAEAAQPTEGFKHNTGEGCGCALCQAAGLSGDEGLAAVVSVLQQAPRSLVVTRVEALPASSLSIESEEQPFDTLADVTRSTLTTELTPTSTQDAAAGSEEVWLADNLLDSLR